MTGSSSVNRVEVESVVAPVSPAEAAERVEPPAPSMVPPESQVERRCLSLSLKAARRQANDRFEIEYVRALLEKSGGNVTRAAALADVSRQVIHKLIARHGLSTPPSSSNG